MFADLFASHFPLTEFASSQDYPIEINVDNGTIYDGGADDNYFLIPFLNVADYTDKKYGVYLEWDYTDGRAKQFIEYIKTALQKSNMLLNSGMSGPWTIMNLRTDLSFTEKQSPFDELTKEHIKEIDNAVIWNTPDKMYPERPSFYCLTITR